MKRYCAVILFMGSLMLCACGMAENAPAVADTPAPSPAVNRAEAYETQSNAIGSAPMTPEVKFGPGTDAYDAGDPLLTELFSGTDWTTLYSGMGRLSPDMPEWSFELLGGDATEYGYGSLMVIVSDETGRAVDYAVKVTEYGARDDPNLILADANFDGYMDVMYSEGAIGAHGHYWYDLLVWDAGRSEFWYAEDFYEICNPVVDAEKKVIRSCGSGSSVEDIYSIYIYKNGMYFLDMELILQYRDEDGRGPVMFEIFSYQDGNEKLVKKGDFIYMAEKADRNCPDLYGPDSAWKLDNPIWYASRHFQGAGE